MRNLLVVILPLVGFCFVVIIALNSASARAAWVIRDKETGKDAYYYEGQRQQFGGPWGDPQKHEQIEVPDRPMDTWEDDRRKRVGALEAQIDALVAQPAFNPMEFCRLMWKLDKERRSPRP